MTSGTRSSRAPPSPRPSRSCSAARKSPAPSNLALAPGRRPPGDTMGVDRTPDPWEFSKVAHRVLVTDKLAEEGLALLRAEPGLEVVVNTKLDPQGLRTAL